MNYDDIIIRRAGSPLSEWTFQLPHVAELISRYIGDGKGWADPFCGMSTLAEWRNDHNPARGAPHCMEAEDFVVKVLPFGLKGALNDPPWSYRQVQEHYQVIGKKATALDTSYNFYRRVAEPMSPKIIKGGYVISCGWDSNGYARKYGWKDVEVLILRHGMHHHDTIVTVQQKITDDTWLG